MQKEKYRVKTPSVVSETIDGEVVIMNLKSGNYYSIQNTGARLWDWIERGMDRGQLIEGLGNRYDASRQDMDAALTAFIERLMEEKLIEPMEDTGADGASLDSSGDSISADEPKTPFQHPVLDVYSDMQDLLLLDPIHDVDETGWPTPKDN